MASLARKIKRQQPVLRAPLARPLEEPPEKVKIYGEMMYSKGYDSGFDAGFRGAYGHFLANMAYIWKHHEHILDNPSNRFRILFDLMRMMNEDYLMKRTPKMLAALEDLRKQGIDVEIKE